MPDAANMDPLFAIVRIDKFQVAEAPVPSDVIWPTVVTVKGIVTSREHAVTETARLNALNGDKDCIYFWQATRTLKGTVSP